MIYGVKRILSVAILLGWLLDCTSITAAAGTWSGQISDSACGAKHEAAAEGEEKMADGDCTRACVRGGSAFVFVAADGTIFKIANQDFPDLAANAGRPVAVKGDLAADTIRVTLITAKAGAQRR
jgi:hypothetical protein